MKLKRFVVILLLVSGFVVVASQLSTSNANSLLSPQPERRFAAVGHHHGQFSEAEYKAMATNYGRVIINKLHGNTINDAHAAAKELKLRNPSLKIEIYYNTKYWYDANETRWVEPGFNPAELEPSDCPKLNGLCKDWYLKDLSGNIIAQNKDQEPNEKAHYYDVSNPDYRKWALEVLQHWMNVAPYDGIHFDSGSDLANGFDGRNWDNLIGPEKVAAFNAGMKDLFIRAKQLQGVREVTFNGISPAPFRAATRSLDKLTYTDGATDENFCISGNGIDTTNILADINILKNYGSKFILLHSSYNTKLPIANIASVGRFCHAAFLMGWVPGASQHKFALGSYGSATLTDYELPELSLNLGHPTANYKQVGQLLSRTFDNGLVFVNLSSASATFKLPVSASLEQNGKLLKSYAKGASYALSGQSSAYFINQSAVMAISSKSGATKAANSTKLVPELSSVKDVPGATIHELASPSDINDLYQQTSNKLFFWLATSATALILAALFSAIIAIMDRLGLLNPLKYLFGKVKSKLLPPHWGSHHSSRRT